MPPCGFNDECVEGILMFCRGLYKAVQAEVASGKHESPEAAWKHEVELIGKRFAKIHINPKGELVER